MRIPPSLACALVLLFTSAHAQTKYGLSLINDTLLHATDTISLSYPYGAAIICVLLDANNYVIGTSPVRWSITGNITIIDTSAITNRVFIDASLALFDQKGYLSAQAAAAGAQWISNRVFITIKGKNSGVLQRKLLVNKQTPSYGIFDCFGRIYTMNKTNLHGVIIIRNLTNKKSKLAIGINK
jgi:hypothetical protein